MKNEKKISLICLLLISYILFSCTKTYISPVNTTGNIEIEVTGKFKNENLLMNKYYALNDNDSIKVSVFKFYLSNFKLKNTQTNQWYSIPNSYLLFDNTKSNNVITLRNIPIGQYSEIAFYTGVDSIANTNEVIANSIPELSPTNDMIWTWHTGYTFYKLEGSYKNINQTSDKGNYKYNVGSNETLAKHSIVLTHNSIVGDGANSKILIEADASKLFTGNTNVDVNTDNNIESGPQTLILMQNYSNMYNLQVQ